MVLPALLGSFAAIGCEDGPNDPYTPASADAGSIWNGQGGGPVAVADGGQGLDAAYPTANAVSLCSTDLKRQRWAWMLEQPIVPPRMYAGIDLAGGDNWSGLTIEQAELAPTSPTGPGGLCQSTPLGFEGGCPSGVGQCNGSYWGNSQEVSFSWNLATHRIDQMVMSLGYLGSITTKDYPDHNGEMHHYKLTIGDVIRRDDSGEAFLLDWNGDPSQAITDIYNSAMATFAPGGGVPFETTACNDDKTCQTSGFSCQCKHKATCANDTECPTGYTCAAGGVCTNAKGKTTSPTPCATATMSKCGDTNCQADSSCLVLPNSGGVNIFGIRPLVVYVQGQAGVPQPALSTPTSFYNFFTKTEPFSNLPQTVKLDKDGPIATGKPSGQPAGGSKVCTQQIGQTFADFKANCVQVSGDATVDGVNLNKVVNGLTHDQEHYTANVLGVNQNFTSVATLTDPTKVVTDADMPVDADIAQDWTFDVRAKGRVSNDYDAANGLDLRGSAMVVAEWTHLMLADAAKQLGNSAPTAIGDPRCTGFDASGQPNYLSAPPNTCTGLEGTIIPAPAVDILGATPPFDPSSNFDIVGVFSKSVLKPGDLFGAFCIDPGVQSDCTTGYSIFANALRHVTRVLGKGNVLALPPEMQDRRYYFRLFGQAYVKYLRAYGKHDPATRDNDAASGGVRLGEVDATDFDAEALFFDYSVQPGAGGAQTFDKFEYVEREYNGQGVGGKYNTIPWDFEYGIDLLGGNQRTQNFYRRMDREEIAMYASMLEDKSKNPGDENNVNITNLFGSDLLAGAFPSFACAIGQAGDPSKNCGGVNAPLAPVQSGAACAASAIGSKGGCPGTTICGGGNSYEAGVVAACGAPCDFTAHTASGCAASNQVCANGACVDALMDRNVGTPDALPYLAHYPGAFAGSSPFHKGHSAITLANADKHPEIGVAKITIPNFADGPYTNQFQFPDATGACPAGYAINSTGAFCVAKGVAATPSYSALTPWLEVQPGVGFGIFLDAQHEQEFTTGQLDFTGVLETYVVDYLPYSDPAVPSCVANNAPNDAAVGCAKGFACNPTSHKCVTQDDTIQIVAIEGADFLGQAFLCQDSATGDILHAGMYDSATAIVSWLAKHPGAQSACNILVIRSPYDNYVDNIVSLAYGVNLNVSGGQGQGRVTDVVLYDTTVPLTP
jgi:hypothetical protein